jgi:hypothetical protein
MKDDRKPGIALIAGSLGGLLTMHIHPTGTVAITTEAQVANLAVASAVAHSLALVSVLLLFLGACGLAKRVAGNDWLWFTAIVTYGFSCVAIMIAAAVSGFIIPGIMKQMLRDAPSNAHLWQAVMAGIFQINQAMARIFSVGSSVAIILWSVSVLRHGQLGRVLAIYGCAAGLAIVIAVSAGLRFDVRGMAAVMVGFAVWFIAAGVQMCTRTPSGALAE